MDTWQIQTSIQTYSCYGINHSRHCNIGEQFISIEILPHVRFDPSINSKAIQNHFKDLYSVGISYDEAYRTKERAVRVINSSHEEVYSRLPKYCEEIQYSNSSQLHYQPYAINLYLFDLATIWLSMWSHYLHFTQSKRGSTALCQAILHYCVLQEDL